MSSGSDGGTTTPSTAGKDKTTVVPERILEAARKVRELEIPVKHKKKKKSKVDKLAKDLKNN